MSATTENSIRLLSSDVVDQIAAGEVVDRPAHLVKELVENAIDAGATAIEIEYDQGGRRVRVTDNGRGIDAEDLSLALARHATSKIVQADDLWSLHTFGFRGEALASIAAVSRLTLQSRTRDQASAHQVISEFGKVGKLEPVGANTGTTVLVEELFANVPARLKFLKSETAESTQIRAALKALALANETVEFRIRTKGRIDCIWPAAESFLERAKQILEIRKLYENQYSYDEMKAHVVFASPHDVSGAARSILTFVQKRWVQDKGLQAAVIDAYRGLLMHGEYPIAVVRLEAPTGEVDVNIHPTKSQVKFRDQSSAFRAVNRCLREALEKAPWLETKGTAASAPAQTGKKLSVADLTKPYRAPAASLNVSGPVETLHTAPIFSTGRFDAPEFDSVIFRQKRDAVEQAVQNYAVKSEAARIQDQQNQLSSEVAAGPWSRLQVLGQAHLTYILAQDNERLVLIDQHAAHERVAYERLMRAWTGGSVDVQTLLIPLSIELEADGAEALASIALGLEKLGVAIDQMGPQTIAVRSKPALIQDTALVKALSTLARELAEKGGSFALEKKIGDLCATMACHSVVRAGQALSVDQMRNLLKQMDEFPLSSFCPHGRPVSVDYPYSKLERDFGRIV